MNQVSASLLLFFFVCHHHLQLSDDKNVFCVACSLMHNINIVKQFLYSASNGYLHIYYGATVYVYCVDDQNP